MSKTYIWETGLHLSGCGIKEDEHHIRHAGIYLQNWSKSFDYYQKGITKYELVCEIDTMIDCLLFD